MANGWREVENLAGGSGNDNFTLGDGGSLSGSIDGNAGTDTVTGDNTGNTFAVTGPDAGTVDDVANGWREVENLAGGSGNDNFALAGGTLTGAVDGGAGTDTLTGDNTANTFNITGANVGTATGVGNGWNNVENLTGGDQVDVFVFDDGASVSGTIDGGNPTTFPGDSLDYSAYTTDVDVNLANGTATGTGGITNIEAATGGSGTNSLTGPNTDNTWMVTAPDSGDINGNFGFTNFQNLTGGSAADTVVLNGGTVSGAVDGAAGNNTLVGDNVANTFNVTGPNSGTATGVGAGFSNVQNLTGNDQADVFNLSGGSLSGTIDGVGGPDTINGDNAGNTFDITGVNSGTISNGDAVANSVGSVIFGPGGNIIIPLNAGTDNTVVGSFNNIENLTGGSGDDTFAFNGSNAQLDGNIDGGGGSNFLDYTNYSGGPVNVVLGATTAGTATGVGGTIIRINGWIVASGAVEEVQASTPVIAAIPGTEAIVELDGQQPLMTIAPPREAAIDDLTVSCSFREEELRRGNGIVELRPENEIVGSPHESGSLEWRYESGTESEIEREQECNREWQWPEGKLTRDEILKDDAAEHESDSDVAVREKIEDTVSGRDRDGDLQQTDEISGEQAIESEAAPAAPGLLSRLVRVFWWGRQA